MTLTALGMTDGVGSMLVGAKRQGYEILGNVEWRRYYHSGTWEHNFNNAWMVHSWDQAKVPSNVTMVMGHPECGQWSALAYSSLGNEAASDASKAGVLKTLGEFALDIWKNRK